MSNEGTRCTCPSWGFLARVPLLQVLAVWLKSSQIRIVPPPCSCKTCCTTDYTTTGPGPKQEGMSPRVPIPAGHELAKMCTFDRVARVPANCAEFSELARCTCDSQSRSLTRSLSNAIVKVLEIAQLRGITPAKFIQMLDSGMPISDFLNAADVGYKGYCEQGKRI